MRICVFLLVLISSTFAQTKAKPAFDTLEIPGPVFVDQQIISMPQGWLAGMDTSIHRLTYMTIYEGRPSEKASLVPGKLIPSKSNECAVWTFDPKSAGGVWIECAFSGTDAKLFKAMPAGTKEIRIYYSKSVKIEGYPEVKKVLFRR